MDFLNSLIDGLANFGALILQVLVYLFNIIVQVFSFVWTVLQGVFNFFFALLKDAQKFFGHVWESFYKKILPDIFNGIVKFGQWLKGIFPHVVKFLRDASKYLDRLYRRYVRPILRILQITRVFLTLLKALGVKWAAKLDSVLGKIQTDIQRGFLTIKGYLNVLIDLANILSDPTNLLRRPTTLLSLRRIFNAAVRQFTGLPPGFFVPVKGKGVPHGLGFLPSNFDPTDPLQNPPPSYYLAFDGGVKDYSFLGPGETVPDTDVDDVDPLGYFLNDYADEGTCDDPLTCLVTAAKGEE